MRVLVASADPLLRGVLAARLDAIAVETDAEAVESLRAGGFEVAVLDRPIGTRTLDLLTDLQAAGIGVPMILVLPRSERAIVPRAFVLGAYECLWRDDLDLDRLPDAVRGARERALRR